MDDTISQIKSKNQILKNSLKNLVAESDQDNTEIDLIRSIIDDDNKENNNNYKLKYFNNLKENINEIKKTEYELPSGISYLNNLKNFKDSQRGGYDVDTSKAYKEKSDNKPQNEEANSYRQRDFYSNPHTKDGYTRNGYKDSKTTPDYKTSAYEVHDDISDPLSEDLRHSPKDNLLLNKLVNQSEVIKSLNQQLNTIKSENRYLQDKNNELAQLNERTTKSKETEINNLRKQLENNSKELLLANEINSLKEEVKDYLNKNQQLKNDISFKDDEIASLHKSIKNLSIKLIIYKSNLNDLNEVNEKLKFISDYLKMFINNKFLKFHEQMNLLHDLINNNFEIKDTPVEDDDTTSLLINESTTNYLLKNKHDLNVDQFLVQKESNQHKSLKSYILMIIFITRIKKRIKEKELVNNKINELL